MIIPVVKPYRITSDYGWRILQGKPQFHNGIDLASDTKFNDVLSIADGIVTYDQDDYREALRWTDSHHSAGNMVIIRHDFLGGLYYIRYLHLGENRLYKGQHIFEGARIGEYADVGQSYGAHLHIDAYDMHWEKINIKKMLLGEDDGFFSEN